MNENQKTLNQMPIPDAALRDEDAVEMLRVWVAERKLHCSIKVGMYREAMNIAEEKAWGSILVDAARHIANALESGYSVDREKFLRIIQRVFNEELSDPTSDAKGDFVRKH
jgi:hypothetical protein